MGRGGSLDLKNDIRKLLGRVKASTDCCGENLAIVLNSVNRRRASGDVTIVPVSSISEDLGIKTVLLLAKSAGRVPPSITCLYALKRNCEPNPAHLWKLYGIPSGLGADPFFESRSSSNSFCRLPSECRQDLSEHMSQDIFMLVMSRTFGACLENRTPIITMPSS